MTNNKPISVCKNVQEYFVIEIQYTIIYYFKMGVPFKIVIATTFIQLPFVTITRMKYYNYYNYCNNLLLPNVVQVCCCI